MCHSGLRVSELCDLSVDSVRFSDRIIVVKGKGGIDRVVPTTQECVDAIKEYLRTNKKSRKDLIFPVSRFAVTGMITRSCYRVGVRHTTAHSLRHTCATNLMDKNVPIDIIQSLLGHRSLAATEKYLGISHRKLEGIYRKCHPRK
jgi:site-specific recombinase XerD